MRNAIKKSLFIAMGFMTASAVLAATPTLSINESSQGSSTYLKTYSTEGITISSSASFSSGAVQLGNTGQAYDQHYIEVLSANSTIDSISYLISGNGSNKSIQAPVFGWATTASSSTADTYRILDAVTVTANSYAAAKWFTYDFHDASVKCLRIYRTTKNMSSVDPPYTGSSTALGSGNTIKVYGLKIWLKPAGPVAVTGVSLNKTSTTLEAGQSEQLIATVAPSNAANQNVTWGSSNSAVATVDQNGLVSAVGAGTATITVTTEDGSKTATCSVTVTAPAAPIEVTGIALSDVSVAVGGTATLMVTYTPTEANTGKAISSWTSSDPTVATVNNGVVTGIAAGTATITATTEGGKSATCTVTVTVVAVTGVSLNQSSVNLQIGGTAMLSATVSPNNASNKNLTWSSNNSAVAMVDQNGLVSAVAAGSATITVASEADPSKTATCAVTVTAGPPVPSTTLTLHEPEKYEASDIAGGYGGTLSEFNGREYEVYYINRDQSSTLDVAVSNTDKQGCITESTGDNAMKAKDGWFTVKSSGSGGETGASAQDEYGKSIRKVNIVSGDEIKLHVKGFDQFSFYGKDNSTGGSKNFEVYINDEKQTMTVANSFTIRRFNLSGESVIRITAIGSSNNTFVAFSLRVAQEPRTKWINGNDSTQVVLQTTAPKPVYYFTKYNSIGETRLEGLDGTGITLSTHATAPLGDTLVLGGIANCPVGTYNYSVVSYYNNVETSRVNGKFFVKSEIKAVTDTIIDAYQNEAIDDIIFSYYALPPNEVTLTWKNGQQPAGISGRGSNGKYTISGTPTTTGTYEFTVTVAGGNSVNGLIDVKVFDPGNNPVLYLYKNNQSYNKDGVYKYLTSAAGGSRNLITRKAKEEGLRPADQYAKYKWVLISEDVDADNAEILALARGECNLPVLSMKAFSYTPGRLGWGEPDNGSLTENGRYITIQRDDHPIFSAWPNKKHGDRIMVLDTVVGKGLMPIDVNYSGTLCLATSLTRDIEDYYGDGYQQTLLHEVPAEMHHNQKYICLPIGMEGSNYLSSDGKKLIDKCIEYILSNRATIELPSLAITEFKIGSYKVDYYENRIEIHVPAQDSDLVKTASPRITLASPITFATPDKHSVNADGTVDFSNWYYGVRYAVSDYINKRYYDVVVRLYSPEGIDNIKAGTWVNIYDIYGRKVTTTNEDLRTIDLPSGMYIVVTDDGQTIKIMR